MDSPRIKDMERGSAEDCIRVSIIIPAKNEAGVIGGCLQSLVQTDFPPKNREVIVVDNGSSDDTVAISLGYAERLNLRVARNQEGYISTLRNRGAAMARGEVLAFLDADCAPAQDWLTEAIKVCSPQRIVGAFYQIPSESSWVARVWYGHEYKEKQGPVAFIPSGDLIMCRDTFLEVGGFDETIETNEDYDFCQRALAAGFDVVAFTQLAVTHFGTPQTVSDFYKKQRWHGKHVIIVTLRDWTAFRNARAVSFAVYTLVCLISMLMGLCIGLLRGGYGVFEGALVAIILAPLTLSAHLAVRRRRIKDLVPLSVLFLTYGVARAMCLLDFPTVFRKASR